MTSVETVLAFIDCINRGDVDGLGQLMTDDHELRVFDEPPVRGRMANVYAWRGYCNSFPRYVISPLQVASRRARVAVLGTTTGSHLGLPDEEERRLTLLWVAEVIDGRLGFWELREDTRDHRLELGLDPEIS